MHTVVFTRYFKFWRYFLQKICKIQPLDLLFIVFIGFYISRYHFSQIFKTSFSISERHIFVTNFPFLTDSLKLPHPLNRQNPLSLTKVFCRCSLKCSKSFLPGRISREQSLSISFSSFIVLSFKNLIVTTLRITLFNLVKHLKWRLRKVD